MAWRSCSRNNCLRPTLRNRFVTAHDVVGTIATDAGHVIINGNLIKQTLQHRRIAGGVVGHFDRPDFQRGRVNAKVDLAPLTTIVGSMLFGLLLTFTQFLDAGAVD